MRGIHTKDTSTSTVLRMLDFPEPSDPTLRVTNHGPLQDPSICQFLVHCPLRLTTVLGCRRGLVGIPILHMGKSRLREGRVTY